MLSACTSSLPHGRCVGPRHLLANDEKIIALAIVRIDPQGTASVEVGASQGSRSNWLEEDLFFARHDPQRERWTATGFLISSLLGDSSFYEEATRAQTTQANSNGSGAAAPLHDGSKNVESRDAGGNGGSADATPKDSANPREPSTHGAASRTNHDSASRVGHRYRLGISAQLSRALSGETFRGGLLAHGHARVSQLPIEGVGGVGWSIQPKNADGLSLRFITFELGVAVPLHWKQADLSLRGSVKILAEHVRAQLMDNDSSANAQSSRTMIGSAWGATMTYPESTRLKGVLGAELLAFEGGTAIQIENEATGSVPGWNYRTFLGLAYGFYRILPAHLHLALLRTQVPCS